MSSLVSERVLVVPTPLFRELGHFQGFCGDAQRYLKTLLNPANVSFRPRDEVEQDPEFKQLIPYVLLRHRDLRGVARFFAYTRGGGQGEARLHNKRSLGIGGHISLVDQESGRDPYREGMRRELEEEVGVGPILGDRLLGMINDDLTPVGQVHLGIVHLWDLAEPLVEPREADLLESGFHTVESLKAESARFETWSQICLTVLETELGGHPESPIGSPLHDQPAAGARRGSGVA